MVGKADLVQFLQRAIGYSLTGLTIERCMFILWGGGKNGKSTLLDTMLEILADHAARTNTDTLMASRNVGIPNDIAALKGMRFVFAVEGEEGRRLAEAKIKDLTGGDTISARFMRGEWFSFRPEFKLWLGTNHRPAIRGTDDAIWDRIRLVPFHRRFEPHEQDKHLKDKLLAEAPGILAWAVEGCLDWQREGLGEPAAVREATHQYRSSEDVVGNFIDDRCEMGSGLQVTKHALYTAYKTWCEQNGEKPVTQRKLSDLLKERGGIDESRVGKERTHYWIGLSLTEVNQNETTTSGRTMNA
jgi:putative DNA primase/helicase